MLAHLCEQGGDPTFISKQGKTAQTITEENGNKIATALLGMCDVIYPTFYGCTYLHFTYVEILKNMQCQVSRRSSALEYEKQEINAVHKTLLHWLVLDF